MGIVMRQSIWNTGITYLGFAIGAVNTLFLYTRFMSDAYYGLVGVILSTSALLMPLMAAGVPNTLVRYYSRFSEGPRRDAFLWLMMALPLLLIFPLALFSLLANAAIGEFLARENAIVRDYVWHIFLVGFAMAYFEVYYAWAKVQLRTVGGNFLKEVFARALVTLLLFLLFLELISVNLFLDLLVGVYLLRTLLMKLMAYRLYLPPWPGSVRLPLRDIITYSLLIILGGSSSVILIEIDRFMINQYIPIENVAYYSVAVFIATVIAVPSRAMQQVVTPLTAGLLNRRDWKGLEGLYQKSSATLLLVSGLIFLLVLTNLQDLYQLLPENYRGGLVVVLLIGLARVFDALLGNNNAILYNSPYYKTVLFMGVCLAVFTIGLNMVFIPVFGIDGAALATFVAVCLYNGAKLWYVRTKYQMNPEVVVTGKILLLILLIGLPFFYLPLPFHPIANIALKAVVLCATYLFIALRLKLSAELGGLLDRWS